MKTNKIVLHIPHSSINGIFDKEIGKWPRNAFFVNTCVKEHTDWFTDMLFTQVIMLSRKLSFLIQGLFVTLKDLKMMNLIE